MTRPPATEIQIGGPYRAAPVPSERVPPRGLTVRRERDELIIEGRPDRWAALRATLFGATLLAWLTNFHFEGGWILVATLLAFATLSSMDQITTLITLRITGDRVSYRIKNLSGTAIEGALAAFQVEGVVTERTVEDGIETTFSLEGVIAGQRRKLFEGLPRRSLEWIEHEIRSWRSTFAARAESPR
jgi:hypothetical protein